MEIRFEKVSFKQFKEDFFKLYNCNDDKLAWECYQKIKLPVRSSIGSAGYDFVSPVAFKLKGARKNKYEVTIPLGIRFIAPEGYMVMLDVRSGSGSKTGIRIKNTLGIIDSDYQNAKNTGHMFATFVNGTTTWSVDPGDRVLQGIIIHYEITTDDQVTSQRTGGFGSSGK